jgi:hypothetical protein
VHPVSNSAVASRGREAPRRQNRDHRRRSSWGAPHGISTFGLLRRRGMIFPASSVHMRSDPHLQTPSHGRGVQSCRSTRLCDTLVSERPDRRRGRSTALRNRVWGAARSGPSPARPDDTLSCNPAPRATTRYEHWHCTWHSFHVVGPRSSRCYTCHTRQYSLDSASTASSVLLLRACRGSTSAVNDFFATSITRYPMFTKHYSGL